LIGIGTVQLQAAASVIGMALQNNRESFSEAVLAISTAKAKARKFEGETQDTKAKEMRDTNVNVKK